MCFSTEASFTAAAALSMVGISLIKKFARDPKIFLALIPFFFALQQFSEGVMWYSLNHQTYPNAFSLAAQYAYLFLSTIFWPVWIPFAFFTVENVPWRRLVMGFCMALGLLFFINLGYYMLFADLEPARIVGNSISYGEFPFQLRLLYLMAVTFPFLLSSIPKMWILGLGIAVAFLVADALYMYAFVTIWCFLAAIVTAGIYFLL